MDLVLRIQLDDDVVLRRLVGRRVDPQTGASYHLEYNPPPEFKGINHRLVPLQNPLQNNPQNPPQKEKEQKESGNQNSPPTSNSMRDKEVIYQSLSFYKEEQPRIETWFSKFGILQDLNGNQNPNDVLAQVEKIIEEVLTKKNKQAELDSEKQKSAEETEKVWIYPQTEPEKTTEKTSDKTEKIEKSVIPTNIKENQQVEKSQPQTREPSPEKMRPQNENENLEVKSPMEPLLSTSPDVSIPTSKTSTPHRSLKSKDSPHVYVILIFYFIYFLFYIYYCFF